MSEEKSDKDDESSCKHNEDEKCAEGMNRAVPGRASRGKNARWKPISRVSTKNTDDYQAESICSNQDRTPCPGSSRVQASPETNGKKKIEHSSQDEIRDLNPSPVSKRKKA